MASGHVNRIYRPNTWQHRPSLQREESPCQPGAVHTWHLADTKPIEGPLLAQSGHPANAAGSARFRASHLSNQAATHSDIRSMIYFRKSWVERLLKHARIILNRAIATQPVFRSELVS